jgi:putative Mg2+ transporter-C (MgtC) family protein
MTWLAPLDGPFWLRIAVAVLCGGLIGLERQLRGKPAGIRTSMLVCLGTALFVRLGIEMQVAGPGVDPTRVLGQVVTGIGFLGAGVILTREGIVIGVTSAAVIWMLAGIGAAIGLDRHAEAVAITLVVVLVLVGVQLLEHAFRALRRGVHAPEAYSRGGRRRRRANAERAAAAPIDLEQPASR